MKSEKENMRAWIVAGVVVTVLIFEEARFARRHNERPSFPVFQAETHPAPVDSAVKSASAEKSPNSIERFEEVASKSP